MKKSDIESKLGSVELILKDVKENFKKEFEEERKKLESESFCKNEVIKILSNLLNEIVNDEARIDSVNIDNDYGSYREIGNFIISLSISSKNYSNVSIRAEKKKYY